MSQIHKPSHHRENPSPLDSAIVKLEELVQRYPAIAQALGTVNHAILEKLAPYLENLGKRIKKTEEGVHKSFEQVLNGAK